MKTLIFSTNFDVPFEVNKMLLNHCSIGFRAKVFDSAREFVSAVNKGGFDFAVADLGRKEIGEGALRFLDSIDDSQAPKVALILQSGQHESILSMGYSFRLLNAPLRDAEILGALKIPMAAALRRSAPRTWVAD